MQLSTRYGQASRLLYSTSGNSMDWAHDKLKIRASFTFELRDRGRLGPRFLLPPQYIKPTSEEAWAALQYIFKSV